MVKKQEIKKVKCPKCGNTTKFHCYGQASVDIEITWDNSSKEYKEEETDHYLHEQGQYSCLECGEDMDDFF